MVSQPLGLLANAIGREALDDLDNPRVERPPALLEKAAVCDLVCQGMPEGVLQIGEEAHLVEQLGGLESGQPVPQRVLVCLVRDGLQ